MPHIQLSSFKKAFLLVALIMSVAWATRIDWTWVFSQEIFLKAFRSYFFAVVISLIPFAALWPLLKKTVGRPNYQLLSAIAITLIAVVGYGLFWSSNTPTGGWEIFIIPFFQAVVLIGLHVFS
jgi:multidrug transporter EmrE-like cation transporter